MQQQLLTLIAPLLWLVPLIVAIVNVVKAKAPGIPPTLVAIATGVVLVLVATYFAGFPNWAQLVVAGAAIGGTASGAFDLTKLLGTIVAAPKPGPTSTGE